MRSSLSVAVAILCTGCLGSPTVPDDLRGDWGGPRVRLTVTEAGGDLEFDCAHGALTARLAPDREGRFDVPGYYVREHGGPVREGEIEERRPTVYAGEVDGTTLTFRFTVDGQTLGPFTVARGRPPDLVKCL